MDIAAEEDDEEQTWIDRVMQLGKYSECKLLAKGGMGAAFSVKRKNDFTHRAVKLALPNNSANADSLEEAGIIKVFI